MRTKKSNSYETLKRAESRKLHKKELSNLINLTLINDLHRTGSKRPR
jgi:hypothetical protein